jgi:hypothetical protein
VSNIPPRIISTCKKKFKNVGHKKKSSQLKTDYEEKNAQIIGFHLLGRKSSRIVSSIGPHSSGAFSVRFVPGPYLFLPHSPSKR